MNIDQGQPAVTTTVVAAPIDAFDAGRETLGMLILGVLVIIVLLLTSRSGGG